MSLVLTLIGVNGAACSILAALLFVSDAVLAERLIRQLQEGLSEQAPFWQQTGYDDPGHPFYSFLYKLVSVSLQLEISAAGYL